MSYEESILETAARTRDRPYSYSVQRKRSISNHGDFHHWEPRQHITSINVKTICSQRFLATKDFLVSLSCDVHWPFACQALGITDLAANDYESGHDARINFSREGFGGAVAVTNGISSTSHDDERGTKNQDLVQIEVQFGGHPSHALYIGMTHIETSFKVEYIKLFQSIGR